MSAKGWTVLFIVDVVVFCVVFAVVATAVARQVLGTDRRGWKR